jgi:hypothetical protein
MGQRFTRSMFTGDRVKSGVRARSLPRVGRGWEGLCWPVYGGRGSGGRGHTVRGANAGGFGLR